MERTFISLTGDRSRGIDALKGTGVPAVFCDAVRVQLAECALLFVSGKIGVREDGTLAGRTMREQTRQVLENIRTVLAREGGTMDDIVRVRVYATQVDAASLRDIHETRAEFWTPGKYPASTLVRVDQLIRDGALIEIDADAVLATARPA
jgi:2-iminobutanoate/2-iminopropanoate deaminase